MFLVIDENMRLCLYIFKCCYCLPEMNAMHILCLYWAMLVCKFSWPICIASLCALHFSVFRLSILFFLISKRKDGIRTLVPWHRLYVYWWLKPTGPRRPIIPASLCSQKHTKGKNVHTDENDFLLCMTWRIFQSFRQVMSIETFKLE